MTWAMRHFCIRNIFVVAAFTVFIGPALAVSTPIEQAVEMLARSQAINAQCNYLTAANKRRLAELVQRAQDALTARENAKAAQTALQRGHDDGIAVACSAAERARLNSTFVAANQAASDGIDKTGGNKPEIAAAPKPAPVKEVERVGDDNAPQAPADMKPPQLLPELMPKQVVEQPHTLADAEPPKHLPPQTRSEDDGLLYYAQIVGDYFLARRCAPGDARGLNKMYQKILETHDDLMRNHAASEVSVVLHRAERAALARSCG